MRPDQAAALSETAVEHSEGLLWSVSIKPGRSLCSSPKWESEGLLVLFDRNSGDYWIINQAAKLLLDALPEAGPTDVDQLLAQCHEITEAAEADLAQVLMSLCRAGILEPTFSKQIQLEGKVK